jgi:hypothetical protein
VYDQTRRSAVVIRVLDGYTDDVGRVPRDLAGVQTITPFDLRIRGQCNIRVCVKLHKRGLGHDDVWFVWHEYIDHWVSRGMLLLLVFCKNNRCGLLKVSNEINTPCLACKKAAIKSWMRVSEYQMDVWCVFEVQPVDDVFV